MTDGHPEQTDKDTQYSFGAWIAGDRHGDVKSVGRGHLAPEAR